MTTPISRRVFGNELKYVQEVLATEFRSSSGSVMMNRFEEAFCKRFGTTLGPAYNTAHRDHLHLELSGRAFCR